MSFRAVVYFNGRRVGETPLDIPTDEVATIGPASWVHVVFVREHPTLEQLQERPLFLSGMVETA